MSEYDDAPTVVRSSDTDESHWVPPADFDYEAARAAREPIEMQVVIAPSGEMTTEFTIGGDAVTEAVAMGERLRRADEDTYAYRAALRAMAVVDDDRFVSSEMVPGDTDQDDDDDLRGDVVDRPTSGAVAHPGADSRHPTSDDLRSDVPRPVGGELQPREGGGNTLDDANGANRSQVSGLEGVGDATGPPIRGPVSGGLP